MNASKERAAWEAVAEAACAVCHRISQHGHASPEAVAAHDRWRARWVAWRELAEEEEGS